MKKAFAAFAVGTFVALALATPSFATDHYTPKPCVTIVVEPAAAKMPEKCPSPSVSVSTSKSASASPSPSKSVSTSPSVSTSVTHSATSSPTAAVPGGSLPVTGSKTWIVAGSGALLIAIGVAALLVARKRDETKFIAE